MISHTVPARVGLLGNPSDGYGGRTLGLAVPELAATVELTEADGVEIVANPDDDSWWADVGDLVEQVDSYGYLTIPQVLAATIRTFADVASFEASAQGVDAPGALANFRSAGFQLTYSTTIPRQVGLGGSSALVIATLRCLASLTDLDMPSAVLPSIALRVETEQLNLTAGLSGRVVQTYGGLMAMNFGEMTTDARFGVSHGDYQAVEAESLPPLFLAYRTSAARPSDRFHRSLRRQYEEGDHKIRESLHHLAALALEGQAALRWSDADRFAELIGENMRLRRQLGGVPDRQLELVDLATSCDANATFAGSGGAIVGAYVDEDHLDRLRTALGSVDAVVLPL